MSGSRGSRGKSSASWRVIAGTGPQPAKTSSPTVPSNKTLPSEGFRLAAYIRLSPSDEIRDEGSLVSHPQRIKHFVDYRNSQTPGWGKIVDWYTDKDYSGKDMNRPEFRRLCRDIKDGKINAVIVTELSRLSRSVKDFCQFWDFLKRHKAAFYSLKESFDTSTPMGELMVVQAISFAQFERETIVSRIKEGAKARAERGLLSGGVRILGYDPDPYKRCYLIVNEEEKPYVKFVFEQFLKLGSVAKLLEFLNEKGYRTKSYITKSGEKRGANLWCTGTLYNLLTNAAYIGRREINKGNRNKNQDELTEAEKYRLVTAQWPAIIPESLFNEVQSQLIANSHHPGKYVHKYRLTGLIRCALCGQQLFGKSGTGRSGKYFYYGHLRKFVTIDPKRHKERCPLESIPAVQVEEAVIARLSLLAKDKALLMELLKSNTHHMAGRLEQLDALVLSKDQERRRIEKHIDGIMLSMADAGASSRKLLTQKLDETVDLKTAIENEVRSLKEQKSNLKGSVIELNDAVRVIRAFLKGFDKRPVHEQKEILKDVMRSITVHPDKLVLEIYGKEAEDEIPFNVNEGLPSEIAGGSSEPEHCRTAVRTAFRVVEAEGIEPSSASDPQSGATFLVSHFMTAGELRQTESCQPLPQCI